MSRSLATLSWRYRDNMSLSAGLHARAPAASAPSVFVQGILAFVFFLYGRCAHWEVLFHGVRAGPQRQGVVPHNFRSVKREVIIAPALRVQRLGPSDRKQFFVRRDELHAAGGLLDRKGRELFVELFIALCRLRRTCLLLSRIRESRLGCDGRRSLGGGRRNRGICGIILSHQTRSFAHIRGGIHRIFQGQSGIVLLNDSVGIPHVS
mmetsp:Transcript_53499/g.81148  ORF Transcript_53499/g.81148 Transcript_53499/m.81148 type:complete len:207 (-) Transcript_53499:2145-2765(-)